VGNREHEREREAAAGGERESVLIIDQAIHECHACPHRREIQRLVWNAATLTLRPDPSYTYTTRCWYGWETEPNGTAVRIVVTPEEKTKKPISARVAPPAAASGTKPTLGLGITRIDVQNKFLRFGITFTTATEVKGEPRVMGQTPDGRVGVELIGRPDNLSTIAMVFAFLPDEPRTREQNIAIMVSILRTATPGWTEATDWLAQALTEANSKQGVVSTSHGNRKITVSTAKLLWVLSVEAPRQWYSDD
jgi:hypothetical protein